MLLFGSGILDAAAATPTPTAATASADPAPTADPEPTPEISPDPDYTGILGDLQEKLESMGNKFQDFFNMFTSGSWLEQIIDWLLAIVTDGLTLLLNIFTNIFFNPDAVFNVAPIRVLLSFAAKFGWMLFVIASLLAVSEIGIQYKSNQPIADMSKTVGLNLFKAFIAVQLFTTVPIPLYKFVINLQNRVLVGLSLTEGLSSFNIVNTIKMTVITTLENMGLSIIVPVFSIFCLILCLVYIVCGIKVLCATIKRSGILLVLMLIGSLHMFSIPRGYWDAFWSWCKQIIALCVTSFCQCIIFFSSFLVILPSTAGSVSSIAIIFASMSLALVACEVPKIAERFGMDSSINGNIGQAVYGATAATKAAMTIAKIAAGLL